MSCQLLDGEMLQQMNSADEEDCLSKCAMRSYLQEQNQYYANFQIVSHP